MNDSARTTEDFPVHGGRVADARLRFPQAPLPFVDLSTGISPIAYPFVMPERAAFGALPEPQADLALREAAARAYGVSDATLIAATPGTQIAINLLPYLTGFRRVAIMGPAYGGHESGWRAAGAEIVPWDGMDGAVARVIVNPNNPDGRLLSASEMMAHADRAAESGGLLIVDEAFAEWDGASVADRVGHPGLCVLRSFGKSYGLAGVRLGFLLGPPDLALRARVMLGDWAVSTLALRVGVQALSDAAWRERTGTALGTLRERLHALLCSHGLEPLGGTRLFTLVRWPEAHAFWAYLGRAGILVRAFPQRPDVLRFGLPADEAAWARLERALRDFR